MATDADILDAAFTRMASLSTSIPTLWPGLSQEPPNSGMWLEISLFPNEPDDLGWEDTSSNMSVGFIQVLVNYRPGDGQVAPTAEAEKVIAHFPKNLEIGPVRVRKKPWMSPSVADESRLFIPITIPYRGIT